MGNGNEASGDGWRFRGRGALQLTGRSNYQLFANYLNNQNILQNPDLVATEFAFESAMFFFDRNNLWTLCDGGVDDRTITVVTRRVNGGTHGLQDRIQRTKRFYEFVK
jgi:putative chitinase